MVDAGCQIPGAIANWDGNNLVMKSGHPIKIKKVLLKITDTYLGIGDLVLENLVLDESGIKNLITNVLEKDYKGKKCIIMKFIEPTERYGTHQVDI